MISIPYRRVLEDVLSTSGIPYDESNADLLNIVNTYINRRVAEVWNHWPWPELKKIEERAFADDWNAQVDYAVDDVVWVPDEKVYYIALQDNLNSEPSANPDDWEETDAPTPKLVKWAQLAKWSIGHVWGVCLEDPRGVVKPRTIGWMETEDGVVVPGSTANTCWLIYTPIAPEFSTRVWNTDHAYDRGDIVYYPGTEDADEFPQRGECYKAEIDVEGVQYWYWVQFPKFLAHVVIFGAAADLARHYRKDEDATRLEALHRDAIAREQLKRPVEIRAKVEV